MSENAALAAETADEPDDGADAGDEIDTTHLDDVEAGAGCTEIWEHLSERRERAESD